MAPEGGIWRLIVLIFVRAASINSNNFVVGNEKSTFNVIKIEARVKVRGAHA